MRLSTFLILPFTLVLASPNPIPAPAANPEPVAAPAPTPAARLEDVAELERRQLTVSLLGATAILSNGVLCGGIGPLTGCFGTPGTQSVRGTVNASGATVSGNGFTLAVSPSTSRRVTTTTSVDAAGPTPGPARAALAAGIGAVALGLL